MIAMELPPSTSGRSADELRPAVEMILGELNYEGASGPTSDITRWRGGSLGSLRLFGFEGSGWWRGRRSARDVKTDSVEGFYLTLPIEGVLSFVTERSETIVGPGDMLLLSMSQPYEVCMSQGRDHHKVSAMHVYLPSGVLKAEISNVDDVCNSGISLRHSAGRIFRSMVKMALTECDGLSSVQQVRYGRMMAESLANLLIDERSAECFHQNIRHTSKSRLKEHALNIIGERLADPTLTVQTIADICGVSRRYLHLAFADSDMTVAGLIREMRLQRCRVALRAAPKAKPDIFGIALNWGFNDAAHFSHAYRARFGHSPKADVDLTSLR